MAAAHSREHLSAGDVVVVNCTHQCNVMVFDDHNYRVYQSGGRAKYYGGFYTHLPARISVPTSGQWNVVLEAPHGARYGMSAIRH